MKRLLFVCDSLEEKGGVEKLVSLQANHFEAQGHVVRILTRYAQNKPPAYPLAPGISVVSYRWAFRAAGLTKLWHFGGFLRWVRAQVRAFRPDWVMTNGLNVGVLTILANPDYKKQVIACDHNHFGNASGLWNRLRKIAYRDIGHIVSLTREDLPLYQAVNPRSVCIYNPVSLTSAPGSFARNRQVLAVGRHTRQKGFDLLLEAWQQVVKAHPDWTLTIVGEGDETPSLKKQIQQLDIGETVHLHPFSDNIASYYQNSNLFVLSSRFEGLSLVLIEAIAMGVPVVAFSCKTGPREVLEQGGGMLVEAENVSRLAQTIIYFIEHPETWDPMSEAGKENAQRFTHDNYFAQWEALLR